METKAILKIRVYKVGIFVCGSIREEYSHVNYLYLCYTERKVYYVEKLRDQEYLEYRLGLS